MKLLPLLAPVLLSLPASAQAIHVVDAAGGGDFTSLLVAVQAAGDGDLLLVRAGLYIGGFTIDGRSLTIAAETGATPRVVAAGGGGTPTHVTVSNLAAHQSVVLQGLELEVRNGLRVEDCAGPVLLQDCRVEVLDFSTTHALRVRFSQSVTVVDTELDATAVNASAFSDGSAVHEESSTVFLHGCDLAGGSGIDGSVSLGIFDGTDGLSGLSLWGGRVVAVGCTIRGGPGGLGAFGGLGCAAAGDGGAALHAFTAPPFGSGAPPEVVLLGTTLVRGPGGGAPPQCAPGSPGPATAVDPTGSLLQPAVAARSFAADGLVQDGALLTLTYHGAPFDFVAVAYSVTAGNPVWVPDVLGALHPGLPLFTQVAGMLDANGERVSTFLNEDQLGIPWAPLWIQPFHFGPEQQVVASNPRRVILFDEP